MDSDNGEFVEVDAGDGNLSLIYHHPKYHPIPPTQLPSSSGEQVCDDPIPQPLFLCPRSRISGAEDLYQPSVIRFPLSSTPECIFPARSVRYHSVLPLFWCNNKETGADDGCYACNDLKVDGNYYYCGRCDQRFHKECVQSPLQIKHPYHPQHSLQLYYHHPHAYNFECFCCQTEANCVTYHCKVCKVVMHPSCAMELVPFVIDQPKRHDHLLTLFPRQASLICNVCGLLRPNHATYICVRCNFVAHNDCMYFPSLIKISRHPHRVRYISSLQPGEWSCGICRTTINGDYGTYTCNKCEDYAVHSRCALREDVCDGEELEDVPEEEEDDITLDAEPFEMISEGVILHFLHEHRLRLKVNVLYDENKLCQACVLPILEGNFYSCMECDFVIHETCVKSRRRIYHALHPHVLTLKAINRYDGGIFWCNACGRGSVGFVYECRRGKCDYDLDVRCASISEPFNYQGHHDHPLFLSLPPEEKPICEVCKLVCIKQLNCIECNFIICFECATLPFKARYKHDKHFLTLLWGKDVCEKDWCEACELNLKGTDTKLFYWCNDCCTTLHVACLFGEDSYLKPAQVYKVKEAEFQILGKSNVSRPLCVSCEKSCQNKRFTMGYFIACSSRCARDIVRGIDAGLESFDYDILPTDPDW